MTITAIARDSSSVVNIVRVVSTSTLAQVATTDYCLSQADELSALNNGTWEWLDNDVILINASDGSSLFEFTGSDQDTFVAMPPAGSLSSTLVSGNILVGSVGNLATSVTMSGDATIIASGALTIANLAINNAKVSATAAIAFSKLAALTDAHILVGSAANVATDVAVTGDVTISNAGVTAIGSNKVLSSMVSSLLLKYAAVTMSSVQFAGAYAAPHLLVAAGGANTLHSLVSAQVLMTYNSIQYANGGVSHIQYDSTANGAGVIASTTQAAADWFDAASTANQYSAGAVKQPFTTCVNKGLYFSNVTGAFDTGNSAFVVHIWYQTIPTV